MMIGTFDLWFGNENGTRLREWCIHNDWPLAWAHDPLDSLWRCGVNTSAGGDCTPPQQTFAHGTEPSNVRLLDPAVLRRVSAGHNQTTRPAFARAEVAFDTAWASASRVTRPPPPTPARRRAVLDPVWKRLLSATDTLALAIEPPWAAACEHECVGVRVDDGSCVCPA